MNVLSNQQILAEFKPERIQSTATISLNGKVQNVFPLFGPIRERDWADGWNPEIVYRSSPEVLAEEHMIFRTDGLNEKYTWVITQYHPEKYLIEYTVSTSDRIWFICVQCRAAGEMTHATVTYTYTGLTDNGNHKNEQALRQMFAHDLKDWEEAINYYLKTGDILINH